MCSPYYPLKHFHAWGRSSVRWNGFWRPFSNWHETFFTTFAFIRHPTATHRRNYKSICIKESFPLINHNVTTRFRIPICCSCRRTENCISRFTESIWVSILSLHKSFISFTFLSMNLHFLLLIKLHQSSFTTTRSSKREWLLIILKIPQTFPREMCAVIKLIKALTTLHSDWREFSFCSTEVCEERKISAEILLWSLFIIFYLLKSEIKVLSMRWTRNDQGTPSMLETKWHSKTYKSHPLNRIVRWKARWKHLRFTTLNKTKLATMSVQFSATRKTRVFLSAPRLEENIQSETRKYVKIFVIFAQLRK